MPLPLAEHQEVYCTYQPVLRADAICHRQAIADNADGTDEHQLG